MSMQGFIVALIVIGCTGYAVWTLMPSALRRSLAQALLRLRWPERIAHVFRRATRAKPGCGGCDSCADEAPKGRQTIKIYRR
jgi:hypothetical protein